MEQRVYLGPYTEELIPELKLGRIRIFDTTLREGEQTPGVAFRFEEKLSIAQRLDELGVDTIEAGFPASSEGEFRSVKGVANLGLRAEVCGLARATKEDVDACLKADLKCIHTFIGTSPWHLKYKLGISEEEALKRAVEIVSYVKDHGCTCEFSCEDATRTPFDFLVKVYRGVEAAGVDRINVPDTVGVMCPEAMKNLISRLRRHVRVPISVHCHNDLGLATANSLAAAVAGARQVQVTVNGLGERAGHASLEQVVVGLELLYGGSTGIKKELITEVSRLVEKYSLVFNPPNYPIVGRNAFAHRSGIHVHGVIEEPACYEPFDPGLVGQARRIVFGKHSGKHGVRSFLEGLGIKVTEEQLSEIVVKIRELGEVKKALMDEDVFAIAEAVVGGIPEGEKLLKLKELIVVTGSNVTPTASVTIEAEGRELRAAEIGVGPVDASARAIEKAIGAIGHYVLEEFKVEAITGGTDSLASVEISIKDRYNNRFRAKAVDDDIVMASVSALMDAINKAMLYEKLRAKSSLQT
ncbi:MAG: 2-isopropylmalate synthase [Candidatus Nezhaarchaeota archaeon]|nr:2-isopropylmalate synthase [Candidatus Nezhaarchaeota archaeon]